MIASALVCGILLTLQTPKSIETGWTEAFSEFARRENVAFVVDVNRLLAPPETLPPIGGRWLLDFLASGQRRRVTEVQGVYVLARSGERGEMAAPIGNTTLLDWLEKLSPEQISKLGGEGLSAKSLDPGMVASLLPHLLGTSPQREKVLKRPWDAEIQLSSYVLFDVQDKGGTRQTYTAEMAPGPWLDTKHETKKPPTWSRTIPLTPAPTDGELRFDEAKLMKLKELIAEAQKCFKAKFAFDRRMEESLILIRGRFNFDRLKAALDPIMNPVLLAPFGEEDVVEARIRGLASRPEWKSILEGDWKGEDRQTLLRNGLDRREMSFADLMKYPRVRERLNQLGLADREGKARLRLSLVIDVRIDDDASGFIID